MAMMENEIQKILYIEDDMASRKLISKLLEPTSYLFYEAADGISGLRVAEEIVPDLILMDLNLPDMSGNELATQIKTVSELSRTIIIAITAMRESHARELSLIAGCDGYLTKPVDTSRFVTQLDEFLEGKREKLDEKDRTHFQIQYQNALVNRLTDKVKQLQTSNYLLKDSTSRLRNYSGKLESLLHTIARLQRAANPADLIQQLVQQVCEQFEYQRCAFLEIDHEEMLLRVSASGGFSAAELAEIQLPYHTRRTQGLFARKRLLYFSSPRKIKDAEFNRLLASVEAGQFLFGILGTPVPRDTDLPGDTTLREQLDLLLPDLHAQSLRDIQTMREHLHEYLSSEMFYFGGFIYVDRPLSGRITPHDVKLLEMLINAASLAYQNLQLREQLTELFIRAEKDAITDHLTNLFNFRYFHQQLVREINRAQRHQSSFCLLMLDIDFFKKYNDTFGHQAGDQVLRRVARLLVENTRSSDIVARYGGEEFVVICNDLDRHTGRQLAEKLCSIIAESPFPQEELLPHKKVTISIGVACYPADALDMKDLIRCADNALYAAKNNGRNQVQVYKK